MTKEYERDAVCPNCGRLNEIHSDVSKDGPIAPKAGDVSICWGCAAVGIYTEDGSIREVTDAEAVELADDPDVRAAMLAIAMAHVPMDAVRALREANNG